MTEPQDAGTGRIFYPALGVLMTALVFAGFWPSYFGAILSESGFSGHWVFHVHAAVFLGWMGVFIAQSSLAARGQLRTHIPLGRKGFLFAGAVFAMGLVVTAFLVQRLLSDGIVSDWTEAVVRSRAPLTDIVQFAVLVGLGYAYRRRQAFHRRFMLLATIAIMPAATGRLGYLIGGWSLELTFVLFVALVVGYDLRERGRIHPANFIGVLILLPRVFL